MGSAVERALLHYAVRSRVPRLAVIANAARYVRKSSALGYAKVRMNGNIKCTRKN
jgi:hypothetical protein